MSKRDRNKGVESDDKVSSQVTLLNPEHNFNLGSGYVWWFVGVIFVAVFFLILKMFTLHPYASDEFIYICQGKFIADGLIPYKDFPMAHPPLQAIFTATLFKMFGYDFEGFRLLGTLWSFLAGVLLAILVKREYGRIASVFSMTLFLLAYEPLRASIHFTGVNMTIALLMGALLLFRMNKLLLCALFCVLAVYTRLYALPAVLAITISCYLNNRNDAVKFVSYGVGLGLLLFIVIGIWTGFGNFMNDVFLFQAQKTAMGEDKLSFMRDAVLFHNAIPFFLFILGSVTLFILFFKKLSSANSNAKGKGKAVASDKKYFSLLWLSVSSVVLILGILLNMNRVWMYYFVLAFPFAAITGGWMVSNWILNVKSIFNFKGGKILTPIISPLWLRISLLLFIGFYLISPRFEKRLDYYKTAMRDPLKRTATYEWRDGYLPGVVNTMIKTLFWKDVRVIGENYSSFTFYLWHCSRVVDVVFEVAEEVKKRAQAGDTIFGDSGTAPLVSLLTKLGISGNEVDTNIERYRSGNADPRELVKRIDVPTTRFLLLRDKFGIAVLPEIQNMVGRNYKEVKSFRSKTGFTLRLYERLPA